MEQLQNQLIFMDTLNRVKVDRLVFAITINAIAVSSVKRWFAIASSFYCPRPGLQSAKPSDSVSRKLAIAISIIASMGYSISTA
jgi:hypothetical protein